MPDLPRFPLFYESLDSVLSSSIPHLSSFFLPSCHFSHNFLFPLFLPLLRPSHLFVAAQVVKKGTLHIFSQLCSSPFILFFLKLDHCSPPSFSFSFLPLFFTVESSQTEQILPTRVLMMKQIRQPPEISSQNGFFALFSLKGCKVSLTWQLS